MATGLHGDQVQIALGILHGETQVRRQEAGLDRPDTGHHLGEASGGHHVASGALGGADRHGVTAEDAADGLRLGGVALDGGGAVSVYIPDVLRTQPCPVQGQTDARRGDASLGVGGNRMITVGVVGAAQQPGQNLRAPVQGVGLRLQHQSPAALADDKAVALGTEGAALPGGGHGLDPAQALDGGRADGGFSRHDDHRVRPPRLQQHGGEIYGIAAGGAGGAHREAGTGDAVLNGKLAGGDIAHILGQQLGLGGLSGGVKLLLHPGDVVDAVEGRAHDDAHPITAGVKPALGHRLAGRGVGILGKGLGVQHQRLGHEVPGLEVPNLSGAVDGQGGRVQPGNLADAADSGGEVAPIVLHPHPQTGDRAHARDDDALFIHGCSLQSCGRPGRRCGRRSPGMC